jgi:allantoin racemase
MGGHVYLLNGNGSAGLTAHMEMVASIVAAPGLTIEVDTVTAAPLFVSNRADSTRAAAAILDHVQVRFARTDLPRPDGVLLACFGEPGLLTLRDVLDVPVVGMLEASALTAMQLGHRFSILTAGTDWPDKLVDLLRVYGVADRCNGIQPMQPDSTASEPAVWRPAMQTDLDDLLTRHPADIVILGGGTAGKAAALTPPDRVRVLDCFLASLAQLTGLMRPSRQGERLFLNLRGAVAASALLATPNLSCHTLPA